MLSRNSDGANVLLLRLTDWLRFEEGGTEAEKKSRIESGLLELVRAMQAAAVRTKVPFLVCLCPAQSKLAGDPSWQEFLAGVERRLVSELSRLPKVQVVTSAQILELYPVDKYEDEYADKVGHIPYSPEFFVALGTDAGAANLRAAERREESHRTRLRQHDLERALRRGWGRRALTWMPHG